MSRPDHVSDDTNRLMRAIAALSAAPHKANAKGRELVHYGEGQEDKVHLICTEVNETVLRRSVTFSSDRGATVTFEVAERRIQRILEIVLSTNPDDTIVGKPLTSDDMPDLLRLLFRLCEGAKSLYVISKLPYIADKGVVDGISCQDLTRCYNSQLELQDLSLDVLGIIEATKPMARAILCNDGSEPSLRWGDEDSCDKLSRLVPAAVAITEENVIRLWKGGMVEDAVLILCKKGKMSVWIILSDCDLSACLALWQKAIFAPDQQYHPRSA